MHVSNNEIIYYFQKYIVSGCTDNQLISEASRILQFKVKIFDHGCSDELRSPRRRSQTQS